LHIFEVRISNEYLKGTNEIMAGLTQPGSKTLSFVIRIPYKNEWYSSSRNLLWTHMYLYKQWCKNYHS